MSCKVESVTNTDIECVTEATSKTHQINNKGTHPVYGEFYDWSPPLLVVEVGFHSMEEDQCCMYIHIV